MAVLAVWRCSGGGGGGDGGGGSMLIEISFKYKGVRMIVDHRQAEDPMTTC